MLQPGLIALQDLAKYESIIRHINPNPKPLKGLLRGKPRDKAHKPNKFNKDIKYKSATPLKISRDSKAGLTIKQ
jgi:hypothetical protein